MSDEPRASNKADTEPFRPHIGMSLEDMLRAEPIRASQPMPENIRKLLEPDASLYTRSASDPKIAVTTERIGASDLWQVSVSASDGILRPGLLGANQIAAARTKHVDRSNDSTDSHRPPWLDLEYVPKLAPFRTAVSHDGGVAKSLQFIEPISRTQHHGPDIVPWGGESPLRYSYPWRTIGCVFVGNGVDFANATSAGSGVLVGRNLLLTASHVAPWGRGPGQWWMRFVPGYRANDPDPEPHSSSYVEQFLGTYSDINDFEASGQDYVICKLYRPLGDAIGWMGSRSFGDEDDYFARHYTSVGYPATFGGRPAVEFDVDIKDIDSDGSGLELETLYGNNGFGKGWSGGPLWLWENERPYVVGIASGSEKDEFDPRRFVFGGGGLLVDRVKFGLANFQ